MTPQCPHLCSAVSRSRHGLWRRIQDVLSALAETPPEIYADIVKNGIYLTGGGALLRGLDKRLEKKLNIKFHVDEDPLHSVAKGAGIALKNIDRFTFLMR